MSQRNVRYNLSLIYIFLSFSCIAQTSAKSVFYLIAGVGMSVDSEEFNNLDMVLSSIVEDRSENYRFIPLNTSADLTALFNEVEFSGLSTINFKENSEENLERVFLFEASLNRKRIRIAAKICAIVDSQPDVFHSFTISLSSWMAKSVNVLETELLNNRSFRTLHEKLFEKDTFPPLNDEKEGSLKKRYTLNLSIPPEMATANVYVNRILIAEQQSRTQFEVKLLSGKHTIRVEQIGADGEVLEVLTKEVELTDASSVQNIDLTNSVTLRSN